jgi:serine/threonine protein kinase
MSLSVGDKLGPYEILAPTGTGGMGEVYKARDPRLDRIVAIKTSKTEFSERFAREARAVGALNHPNICQIYDLGRLPQGGGYLVMEFIDGAPIAPVDSTRKLLDLAMQIADGVAAAHLAGFTHRDLKPDNILVTGPQTPHPGRVKILDFGLAKLSGSIPQSQATQSIAAVTDPGTVVGKNVPHPGSQLHLPVDRPGALRVQFVAHTSSRGATVRCQPIEICHKQRL